MRHIEPRIGAIVDEMVADGVERFVAIALAPQKSSNAAGYRRAVDVGAAPALDGRSAGGRLRRLVARPAALHRGPGRDHAEALAPLPGSGGACGSCSPPTACRPGSSPRATVYPDELAGDGGPRRRRLGLAAYEFAFQSAGRTGEPWLGPDILDEIRRLGREGVRELVVRPVGFVADHLEVLYDIDIEAQAVAREAGIRLERARSMNDDPTFIAGLADLAETALAASRPSPR